MDKNNDPLRIQKRACIHVIGIFFLLPVTSVLKSSHNSIILGTFGRKKGKKHDGNRGYRRLGLSFRTRVGTRSRWRSSSQTWPRFKLLFLQYRNVIGVSLCKLLLCVFFSSLSLSRPVWKCPSKLVCVDQIYYRRRLFERLELIKFQIKKKCRDIFVETD